MTIKSILGPLMFLCLTNMSFGQFEGSKQVFSSPKLLSEIARHKVVAILPFQATITYKKLPKNFDADAKAADEQKLATSMQQGMYTYLLR